MNHMTKIALAAAGILSMGALTACQSANTAKDTDHPQRMHGQKHDRHMTPEQREQMQEMRAERHEVMSQMKRACDGKAAGATAQVKAGGQTINGTCAMAFSMDKPERCEYSGRRGEHRPMGADQPERGEFRGMHMQRGEPLTDAKRAELTQQFDQRLAERQAKQQAIAKACLGKADGAAVQIKAGGQTINGKCEVRFQPKMPAQPAAPAPVKAS